MLATQKKKWSRPSEIEWAAKSLGVDRTHLRRVVVYKTRVSKILMGRFRAWQAEQRAATRPAPTK